MVCKKRSRITYPAELAEGSDGDVRVAPFSASPDLDSSHEIIRVFYRYEDES